MHGLQAARPRAAQTFVTLLHELQEPASVEHVTHVMEPRRLLGIRHEADRLYRPELSGWPTTRAAIDAPRRTTFRAASVQDSECIA